MRDLKHLIYFENLLENADNELVKQAPFAAYKFVNTYAEFL